MNYIVSVPDSKMPDPNRECSDVSQQFVESAAER